MTMDLVRKILLACEASEDGAPSPLVVEGYSDTAIGFHATLLIEAGLVIGVDVTRFGGPGLEAIISRLTWEGYEFLDSSRSETIWERAKRAATAGGGASLSVLKAVLSALGTAEALKLAGINRTKANEFT